MAGSTGARTLSRDYKDVRRHRHVAVGHGFNGWVGLGIGLALGLLVALGVHLHYTWQVPPGGEPVPAPAMAPASATAADAIPDAHPPAQPLDFYEVLPRQELEVAEASRTPRSRSDRPPLPSGDVVLQAGAFKQAGEAEKMVEKLRYLGIHAYIQRAPVDDETWYRVRIGPVATVEELEDVRAKLQDAEISATSVTSVEEMPLP